MKSTAHEQHQEAGGEKRRKWSSLRPFDLFTRPERVAVARGPAGLLASDGVVMWNLGYWEPTPVIDSLSDGAVYHLRTKRADLQGRHDEDLPAQWRSAVGAGPDGHFQARRTDWSCLGFLLWAAPRPAHGPIPLLIDDGLTGVLRGQCFRLFTDRPEPGFVLIMCGYDIVGAVRPLRLDADDGHRADARLLTRHLREARPLKWPDWGPV